eukprot:2751125-Rhodomonas_salina.1
MGQLDDGLGGVVLTGVVATEFVRIDASVLEQGVERRLVDAAGGVLCKYKRNLYELTVFVEYYGSYSSHWYKCDKKRVAH